MAPPTKASKDLIRTGPKHVQSTGPKHISAARRSKRDDKTGEKPTTTRALILRNGKHGINGAGEMMMVSKLTGREKLDLLAEDLVEKSKTAILEPFRIDHCMRIAEAQFSERMMELIFLHDGELFSAKIEEEISSRKKTSAAKADGVSWMNQASEVARAVSDRIHNSYLMASAWHLVYSSLLQLKSAGISDSTVVSQLKNNTELRSLYLVLVDLVDNTVDLSRDRFALLTTTAEHFSKYFKKKKTSDNEDEEYVFDWDALREAARSFLDSIILELCFPRAPYPQTVLYQILRDAIDESPKEAKFFPQSLWNAAGDYSEAVALKSMLDTPLLGTEAQGWKGETRNMPLGYQKWIEAQPLSITALDKIATFKDTIYPISKAKNQLVLDTMWKQINQNFKSVSGKDADTLWGLPENYTKPSPHWSPPSVPYWDPENDDDDEGGPPKLTGIGRRLLAIREKGEESDSDDGMPPLQDVSDSDSDDISESDEDSDSDGEDSDFSGYDTDQEDEMRELLREAMDTAVESPWYTSQKGSPDDVDPLEEERQGNPFLKLLGSLRGRMFTSGSKLRTSGVKVPKSKSGSAKKASTSTGGQAPPKTGGVTIEEVDDEDDGPSKKKKKKKKSKKKKKATTETAEEPGSPEPTPAPVTPVIASPPAPVQATPPSPAKAAKKPAPSPKKPAGPSGIAATVPGFTSTTSLTSESAAQSARSYLQSQGLDEKKSKTKTRSDQPSLFSSVKARFGFGKPKAEYDEKASVRRSWFQGLPKKTKTLLHQLLRTAEDETRGQRGMKWEAFVKLLTDLGFTYDPSTAGSSVRFDPPNPTDRAISFHKPHPDTMIDPIKLKEWSKKLRTYYGWMPEDVSNI